MTILDDDECVHFPPISRYQVKVKIVSVKQGEMRVPDPDEFPSIFGNTVWVVTSEHRGYFNGVLAVKSSKEKAVKAERDYKAKCPNDECYISEMVIDAEVQDGKV